MGCSKCSDFGFVPFWTFGFRTFTVCIIQILDSHNCSLANENLGAESFSSDPPELVNPIWLRLWRPRPTTRLSSRSRQLISSRSGSASLKSLSGICSNWRENTNLASFLSVIGDATFVNNMAQCYQNFLPNLRNVLAAAVRVWNPDLSGFWTAGLHLVYGVSGFQTVSEIWRTKCLKSGQKSNLMAL